MGSRTFPVILETFYGEGAHLRAPNVRLVEGQGLPTDMRVDCCTEMRTSQPLGSFFELQVKLVPRQTGFALYAARKTGFEVLTRAEVLRRIAVRHPVQA